MRQLIVLVVGILAGAAPAYGQNISGGVKGGISFATIPDFASATADPTVSTSVRSGLVIGGFVSIPLGSGLSVQPEVLYAQKGLDLANATGGPITGDARIKIDYVDIPVLLAYRFASSGRNYGYVFGGPSFGFNVRARVTGTGTTAGAAVGVEDEVKDSEFGLVFGGGAVFGRFLVEARWTEGLSAVNDSRELIEDVRNRSAAVLFGVRF